MDETKGLLKRARAEATGMFSEVAAPDFKGSMEDIDGERRGQREGESVRRGGVSPPGSMEDKGFLFSLICN